MQAELTVLDNSQCGFWSDALTGGLRPTQLCAGDTTAQAWIDLQTRQSILGSVRPTKYAQVRLESQERGLLEDQHNEETNI